MGKPTNEQELFRWHSQHAGTPALSHVYRGGRPDRTRQATIHFMSQFSAAVLRKALCGEEFSKEQAETQKGWGLYHIVRKLIEIVEDTLTDHKGRPLVQPQTRITALQKLREFHIAGAATHREYVESRDGRLPDAASNEPLEDPIVLKLQAAESEAKSS